MTAEKKVFNDAEPELIAHNVEAELSDCRTTLVINDGLGCVEIDVPEARAIRDWLNKVLPT